jgi:hypothetical protein
VEDDLICKHSRQCGLSFFDLIAEGTTDTTDTTRWSTLYTTDTTEWLKVLLVLCFFNVILIFVGYVKLDHSGMIE